MEVCKIHGIASSRLEKRRFASAKLNQRLWWTRPDCAHAIIGELLNQLIRTDVLSSVKLEVPLGVRFQFGYEAKLNLKEIAEILDPSAILNQSASLVVKQ